MIIMNKRNLFIIGSLMLMSVVIGACSSAPTATPTVEATAASNPVNLSTAAEGNLEPLQTTSLNFTGNGQIAEVLVKEGDNVTRGQKIAAMGRTDSDKVKLHFEVRRFGRPVDPARFLPLDNS